MKNKQAETKWKSGIGLARHLFGHIICLGAVILICSSGQAQNLFVIGYDASGGKIFEFTPEGVQSTFASGFGGSMAFDSAGNLFSGGSGAIYKFTPEGVQTTFALGLPLSIDAGDLAFDSAGNLFVTADVGSTGPGYGGTIYKFTPEGVRTTFASGLIDPRGLAIDSAGNLFVNDYIETGGAAIYKFTPEGVRSTFASGLNPTCLACDNAGNLFVGNVGDSIGTGAIYKFTPEGARTTFASGFKIPYSLTFDSAGNLFVADFQSGGRKETDPVFFTIYKFTPGAVKSTFASSIPGDSTSLAFQPIQTAPTPTPTPVTTPTPTPTPTPTATPAMPAISLDVSPASVNKGGTATFTATASVTDPFDAMVVNFSTGGNAGNGSDYTLSANQITIPAGQSTGSVTLQVMTTKTTGKERATMTLQAGTGCSVVTKNKANVAKVIIHNK
jgi:sugar lactone lactonase YvrE